jgi:hypothetical protein
MYRLSTRIARQVGRRAVHTVVPFHDSHMHRNRIRTTVGATTAVIAIFRRFPCPCRVAESDAIDLGTRHGFTDSDAERREGSP